MRLFLRGAAEQLQETDYADACPIATVALEVASTNEALRQATADVFDSWITAAADRFTRAGIPSTTARELAISALAALEGAFILSRATRSPEPVQIAGAMMTAAVRAASPSGAPIDDRELDTRTGRPAPLALAFPHAGPLALLRDLYRARKLPDG